MINSISQPNGAGRLMAGSGRKVVRRRQALVSVVMTTFLLVGSLAEAKANRGQGVTLEFYALTTHATFELTNPPQPGQRAMFGRNLYVLGGTREAPEPTGEAIGRNTIICTMITMVEASCEGRWVLDGLGMISGAAFLDFTQPEVDRPAAPLTGGSGIFRGARGEITNFSVPGGEDQVWIIEILGRSGR